ncbi:segregation/condensation protein A [Sporolactobacillus spathodeae]|uniref:Segregation and condensation protein A n=1 Tax=Sporolactobacillus spathodeae TaxID=1465502 RepID=A0ABS2Q7T0_9BACL|nr:segregation/condensation protein A [Sporolactobacillus spathodeae]MBM7657848.1 segregation and condensation protein A [Sporolactobacillus spathodeae]
MEYNVKIDAFEGPLDLLLHLIKQFEIDIYDIPVSEITDQYLDFIHQMQRLELNVASEYLVMAATLIAMKSRMLLPKPEILDDLSDEPYEDPEDTRQALMRQLIDYKQFKEVADSLRVDESRRLLLLAKPADDLTDYETQNLSYLPTENRATVYDMMRALERMIARRKLQQPLSTKIDKQVLPITKQMTVLVQALRASANPISFCQLAEHYDRIHLVVTFLAILELMKKKAIICRQDSNFSDILIQLGEEADHFDTDEETFDY